MQPHHEPAPSDSTRRPSQSTGVYWAESALIPGSPVVASSPEGILAAVLPTYDVSAPAAQRLDYRRWHAVNLAAVLQVREVRAAERGELGVPWTLTAQRRVVRDILMASRGAPPPRYVRRWPSSQPRLVLCSHYLARGQTPVGNVLVLDAGSAQTLLDSMAGLPAELLTWGEF